MPNGTFAIACLPYPRTICGDWLPVHYDSTAHDGEAVDRGDRQALKAICDGLRRPGAREGEMHFFLPEWKKKVLTATKTIYTVADIAMLSGTTLSAVRALLFIGQQGPEVISPKRIAAELGESPSYLSKVSGLLVKAGVLRAEKGVKGGVQLAKPPPRITLLEVVEACQGTLSGGHCRADCDPSLTCSFHRAAIELESATAGVLSRWTLAKLLKKPYTARRLAGGYQCVMLGPGQVRKSGWGTSA